MATISIIGSGFVGEHLGRGFMSLGHELVFYDAVDKDLPNFMRDLNFAIEKSDISSICVPTSIAEGKIDLQYVKLGAPHT